jgi:DNA recombination protein RmuC
MESASLLIALLSLNLALVAFLIWRTFQTRQDPHSLILLQNQIQDLSRGLDSKLGQGTDRMFEGMRTQAEQAQRMTEQLSRQLMEVVRVGTETRESTKQVFTLAEQLSNLEKVLKNQKQRGNLGERSLELVLGNMLPPNLFAMQYEFPGGDTVDAAIFTNDGLIPIDAKFPLENYTRMLDERDDARREQYAEEFKKDLKKRIDETSKYVRPKDGTLSMAFMYIPSEAIYYDLLNDGVGAINTRSLLDYAQNDKKVTIVSPTTFAAYLTSVLYGFKAFKIEREAEDIKKNVEALGKHLKAYDEYYKKLGSSLSTTVNHFNAGYKELGKVEKDVTRITEGSIGLEPVALDRPILDD